MAVNGTLTRIMRVNVFIRTGRSVLFRVPFQEVGSLHIRDGERKRQRIHGERLTDGILVLGSGESHMPADSHCLLPGEAYESAHHVDGFLPMTVGQRVVYLVPGLLFPLTGLFVLDVAPAYPVEIHLAHVVQQRDYRHGFGTGGEVVFLLHPFPLQIRAQAVVYVKGVPQKSALKGVVVPRACRGGKEIALILEKVQQLVCAVPGDIPGEYFQEFFLVCHCCLRRQLYPV